MYVDCYDKNDKFVFDRKKKSMIAKFSVPLREITKLFCDGCKENLDEIVYMFEVAFKDLTFAELQNYFEIDTKEGREFIVQYRLLNRC